MSSVVVLMALAVAQKRREEEAAARRRRLNAQAKKDGKKGFVSGSSYSFKMNYIDCVEVEFSKNEEFRTFFEKLHLTQNLIRSEKLFPDMEAMNKKYEKLNKMAEELGKKEERLEELGISLEEERGTYLPNNKAKLDERNEITFVNEYINVHGTFNGIKITKEMIENENDTTYLDRYNAQKEKNIDVETRKEEATKKLKSLELRSRFAVTAKQKEEANKKVAEAQRVLETIESDIQKEQDYEKDYEMYKQLTSDPETREALKDYIEYEFECFKLSHEIEEDKQHIVSQKHHSLNSKEQEELRENAIKRMVQEGDLTPEKLQSIYTALDKVALKAMRGGYTSKVYGTSFYPVKKDVEWFIESVYEADESFVDRNMELLVKANEEAMKEEQDEKAQKEGTTHNDD